jgi:hypothetical protein
MGKLKLNYSVCQYTPDPIRKETINIGVAFHCPNPGFEFSDFVKIKNSRRIRSFDDEYDSEYMNIVFESLSYQFDYNKINTVYNDRIDEFENINSNSFIHSKTRFYVNEFHFLPQKSLITTTNDISKDIEDITKTYLYYDVSKNERISSEDVRRLIKKHIANYDLKNELEPVQIKDYDDKEIFDFKYNSTLVKAISLDYQKREMLSKNIKSFLFDVNENKERLVDKTIKIVINDNYDEKNQENNKIINLIRNYRSTNIQIITFTEYIESMVTSGLN